MKHVVGKTTLTEGFTISHSVEEWINAPGKQCLQKIRLFFEDQHISAVLRRVGDEKKRQQINYSNADGEPFRRWLAATFTTTLNGDISGYIEVTRIGEDTLHIAPFPYCSESKPTLKVEQWLFHQGADNLLDQDMPLAEIPAVVESVPFVHSEGQSFYNQAFARSFRSWNWNAECRVIPELGLKSDFEKDGVQVEVEFGNARTYYQDFTKFLLGNRYAGIQLGVLVVPTLAFARHLCEVGRQRAVQKGRRQYSGMIDFDKVHREFNYLEFMLPMPIAIAGIAVVES